MHKITYIGIGEIDRGDNVCIMGGPRIQVTQPKYGSTARFPGLTDISSVIVILLYCSTMILCVLFTVTDYLAVGPGSAPGIWAVVPGVHGTHLKHRFSSPTIGFK